MFLSLGPLNVENLDTTGSGYPVVVINWVQYLGPPGPFSFPDSRDLLEVLKRTFLAERGGGALGDPPGPRGSSLGGSLSVSSFRDDATAMAGELCSSR